MRMLGAKEILLRCSVKCHFSIHLVRVPDWAHTREAMKLYFAALLLFVPLSAQDAGPGMVRGTLVLADAGTLQVKQISGATARCAFDSHTWIERDRKRLSLTALEPGVPVEVLTDLRAGRCYTRIIRIVPEAAALVPVARRSGIPAARSSFESIFPRGNLTFAGVVLRRSPTLLVLRTRTEPEQKIVLRDDTRFVDCGVATTPGELAVNTRVFIRGGRNFENILEAYQVMWGEIDGP
jgi:hypothetical protein